MNKKISIKLLTLIVLILGVCAVPLLAQVTTSEIVGTVTDANGAVVAGATVVAVHTPSGTRYSTTTNGEGGFTIPAVRVGGPYTVTVSHAGFTDQKQEGINAGLGNAAVADFVLSVQGVSTTVTVTDDTIFNPERTGAATNIDNATVATLPTTTRRFNDFLKLSPLYSAGPFGGSFAGQDDRFNNITVDGAYFNNSFGLSDQPGNRTGVSPISLDAIQEFQINVSPFDVRQGNFVGAGVNTITKSGTNTYHGSFYYDWRNQNYQGYKTGNTVLTKGKLDYKLWGLTVGGPLPFFNFGENNGPMFISGKNKLFFFLSFEKEDTNSPANSVVACTAGAACGTPSVSRVLASDLNTLSTYLKTNFGYDTGGYQGYNFDTPAKKWLYRTDYNINDKNRLNVRYLQLDSSSPTFLSTSTSGGAAGRARSSDGSTFLSFQNSNYEILENIRSIVGEWNSSITSTVANSLIVGYSKSDESRPQIGKLFPLVDIYCANPATCATTNTTGGTPYTTFGYEPFTPLNTLKYHSLQVQDNLSFFKGPHSLAAGLSFEKYHSLNIFFPESQSVYSYDSLAQFYADANAYLSHTASPQTAPYFSVRFSNIPNSPQPIQPMDVVYLGFYGQDQWRVNDHFTLTYGLRAEVPFFGNTGYQNPLVAGLTFVNTDGSALPLRTDKLPGKNFLWSPRVGFNWTPLTSGKLQVRGGTGVLTARPPYVWISNQIGNNGVLTGITTLGNSTSPGGTAPPFNPNPDAYKPTSVTGAPIVGAQDLNFTVPGYKFPQVWRTSIGGDYKFPLGLIASTEFMYDRDVNGTYYFNANLPKPNSAWVGPDARPRYLDSCPDPGVQTNRLNCSVLDAYTLTNESVGRGYDFYATLEKPFAHGFYVKGGYAYGIYKNLVDASTTAGTSVAAEYVATQSPNAPPLGYSSASLGNRFYAAASYHIDYFKFGGTTISSFWQTKNYSNGSYRVSGDLNGDAISGNDLIYIEKTPADTIFVANGAFTPAQESAAWDTFISQDKYLSKHRGEYTVRGAAWEPFYTDVDLSVSQDVFLHFWHARHRFEFRADILNFGNLLNKNWGAAWVSTSNFQPLLFVGTDSATGQPTYRLQTFGGQLINTSYVHSTSTADTYRILLSAKYSF